MGLIEVVIAVGLLVTLAAGVAHLFAMSARSMVRARNRTTSLLLAVDKLEQLRAGVRTPSTAMGPRETGGAQTEYLDIDGRLNGRGRTGRCAAGHAVAGEVISGFVDRMHSQSNAAGLSPRVMRRPTTLRWLRRNADRTVRREAGFSLLETVMALALTLLVLGALFELARPAASLNRSLPETANVQQRLRHAFDRLHADLLVAGRGTVLVSPGPLSRFLPPVVPYRLGLRAAAGEHRRARPSAVTTLSVSRTSGSETTIVSPIVGPAPVVRLDPGPGCAPPVCGYGERDLVLVFDEHGAWELFRVAGTGAMTLALERAHATSTVFAPGAVVAPIELHHYYADTERLQLRHYDGWQGDFPLVDDLVDLRFRFFGDAAAPACQAPAVPGPRVEIGLAELTDGPWCGPAGLPFDADLLRIRAVAVDLRVQSAVEELRGADPRFFARPGSARGLVPDYGISFTVAPRNMSHQ